MSSRLLTLDELDTAIEGHLFGSPMGRGQRLMGIEWERLVLHRETHESAPLAFCREVLHDLVDLLAATPTRDGDVLHRMRGRDFVVSMEPGGQVELATDPCPTLSQTEEIVQRVSAVIEHRLAATPYELVALGHAPVTRVEQLGLLPRRRYQIMDAEMPQRGVLSRNMMRATAGIQFGFDFSDRADASRKMALMYRLAPVLLALSANSRTVAGRDSGYASYRHLAVWQTDYLRSRVPKGCLHLDTAVDGYVRYARDAIVLFQVRDGALVPAPTVSLAALVVAKQVTEDDLALHLTSLFPLVRIRNYLEVRCFDSVPWPLAKSLMALVSGIMYCEPTTSRADAISSPLAIDDDEALTELHIAAARVALDARVPDGPSLRDIAAQLIDFSDATLGRADCGWACRGDLAEVRARL